MGEVVSIRPFIGAKDYNTSRAFYACFGFEEIIISKTMSYFKINDYGFYLQDAYIQDWIDNSMLFLEVENLLEFRKKVLAKNLSDLFTNVRVSKIHVNAWGNEFFVHDPSGVLWHIGHFNSVDG
jgi:hypothetical protein